MKFKVLIKTEKFMMTYNISASSVNSAEARAMSLAGITSRKYVEEIRDPKGNVVVVTGEI